MFRRQTVGLVIATLAISVLFGAVFSAEPPDKNKNDPSAGEATKEKEKQKAKSIPCSGDRGAEKLEAEVTKMLAEYDLKPHPRPEIPDNPPPHEGAMITLPLTVEPPDLILVEVLEALPGRPISGERLLRPDGKLNIGFYGDVYVKGLTPEQVKVAIIKRLRKFLTDENLGLVAPAVELPAEAPARPPLPKLPDGKHSPLEPETKQQAEPKPRSTSLGTRTYHHVQRATPPHRPHSRVRELSGPRHKPIVRVSTQAAESSQVAPSSVVVPTGPQGKVTITIEVQGQGASVQNGQPGQVGQESPDAQASDDWPLELIPPAESDRVFVDITAYNSKDYYVLGDVMIPGKLPWTGNETVLDALQYAGGLISSAEPKDIRLVRPGRNGKPAKVFKVDVEAIQGKGDVMSNYQIFPNDRLVVGRDAVVKTTVAMDRLNAPLHVATSSIQGIANMLRAVQLVDQAKGGDLLKELVEFWAKEVSRKDGPKFDENTLRDALLKKLQSATTPKK